jgi:hypothetical protein
MPSHSMDKMDAQPHFRTTRIDDYYVDQDKLYALLKNQFGSAFEVKVSLQISSMYAIGTDVAS